MTDEGAQSTAIEVATSTTLFGTTDPAVIVARMGEVSEVLMQAVHERGLSRRYGDADREFLHIEGWQFLGSMLGVSAVVAWSRPLPDGTGWEARSEAVTLDGRVIGAGEGMCQRGEPGRRNATEHAIRAMAQVRARRSALRSVLAFVAAIGGLDLSDPDAPATRAQVVALHTLAGKQGWTREEAHRRASVMSFNDVSREQAAELIDAWSTLLDEVDDDGSPGPSPHPDDENAAGGLTAPRLPAETLDELWDRAIAGHGSKVAVLRAALELWPSETGIASSSLTVEQLEQLVAHRREDVSQVSRPEGPHR